MKANDRIRLMSEGNVSKALFKLGFPIVVSMLVMALYNVVDTYFVSGLGTTQVAAVSVAFPLSLIFSGIGLTFGVGGGSYISRLLGAEQRERADQVASTSLYSGAMVGLLIAVVIIVFLDPVLRFMGATETILPYARSYTSVFLISAIFSVVNVASGNLAIAQGASNISLTAMICGAVLNIFLDPLFIYQLGLGIRGAAIATLISQIITTIIYGWFFAGGKSYLKIGLAHFRPSGAIYREVIKIGLSMFFLQALSSLSMSLISRGASGYGDEAVAAMGIVLRIVTLGCNVVFGYMKGFQPLAGFNYGARNYSRLQAAICGSVIWTTIFGIVWTALIFIFAKPVISLFSPDPRVIALGVKALLVNTIVFFTFGFQFTYSTLYLALGKAASGMFLNVSRQGIFFIPAILLLPKFLGLDGVIYAQAVADLLTTIITVIFAYKIRKEIGN
jgi:putative MATE family efflux protein